MAWKAGRAAPRAGAGSWDDPAGGEMRLAEPGRAAPRPDRLHSTARAARFDKTAAAAASNRPEGDDDAPWTHVPARDPGQPESFFSGRLRRWLRAALGRSERAAGHASPEPPSGSPRRRPPAARLLPSGPEPGPGGTLPTITPRRSGGLARTR